MFFTPFLRGVQIKSCEIKDNNRECNQNENENENQKGH